MVFPLGVGAEPREVTPEGGEEAAAQAEVSAGHGEEATAQAEVNATQAEVSADPAEEAAARAELSADAYAFRKNPAVTTRGTSRPEGPRRISTSCRVAAGPALT